MIGLEPRTFPDRAIVPNHYISRPLLPGPWVLNLFKWSRLLVLLRASMFGGNEQRGLLGTNYVPTSTVVIGITDPCGGKQRLYADNASDMAEETSLEGSPSSL
ncbi:unnamed protein product [Prunus brigantina]